MATMLAVPSKSPRGSAFAGFFTSPARYTRELPSYAQITATKAAMSAPAVPTVAGTAGRAFGPVAGNKNAATTTSPIAVIFPTVAQLMRRDAHRVETIAGTQWRAMTNTVRSRRPGSAIGVTGAA